MAITERMADELEELNAEQMMDAMAVEANLDALAEFNFCDDIWPTAKRGLEILRDNVFTGGGPGHRIIRWAINTIIRVVDSRCGG
jgi:hypothetical protein